MTPEQLRALGTKQRHGWQTRLANALPVSRRTVVRWLSGESAPHPVMAKRVRQLLKKGI
jgi:predicted transcriptional regulator